MLVGVHPYVVPVPASVKPAAQTQAVLPPAIAVSPPVRLVIPSINIDTTIKPAGLTSDGDMAIDDTIDDVAWYQLGYKPGEVGSAVIAGHYGWRNGQAAIFNDLHTLSVGDTVQTYDQAGAMKSFIVREVRKYDPTADATQVFSSTDGKAHLNLITCGGVWVNAADSYSYRLVVFTDLE